MANLLEMMTEAVHPERLRLAVDERRSRLISVGVELFSRHSYDELSVDDIARRAGVSKGLLYHYFDGKRGFYVETVREAARTLCERVEAASFAETDELSQLKAGISAYLGYVSEHARAYVTLLRGGIGYDPEVAAVVEGTRQHFLKLLLEHLEEFPDQARLRSAFRGWIGFVEAASLDWVEKRDLDQAELAQLLLSMAEQTVLVVVGLKSTG
jgi:AcrR family transcriptional regulator